jgi:hydrogenase maturation protease
MPVARQTPLLVLGLGNILCSDDGLGVVAIHRLLRRYTPPEGVRVLDGGTLGLSLLPHLEDSSTAILVDAVHAEGPPGSLVRLEGDAVAPAVAARLSPHQVGVADLLDAARWRLRSPETLLLLGVVPETLALGVGLSPAVAAAVPELVDRIVAAAAELRHAFREKAQEDDEGVPAGNPAFLAHTCAL